MEIQSRKTRQKEAIRNAFVKADRPLSYDEVHSHAGVEVQGISIATVYRNVKALLEEHWLTPVLLPGETPRYEVAGKEHHHHFFCNDCRRLLELQGCEMAAPPLPQGFRLAGHEFFLYGHCSDCRGGTRLDVN